MSLRPSATHYSYLLQRSSATDAAGQTSSLHDVHFCGTVVNADHTSYHVSHIWYETPLSLHLGGTPSDRPTDIIAFSVIIYLVVRSNVKQVPIPGLFRTIAQDAMYYFLVIFTSHFVLVMFQAFAHVRTLSLRSIFFLRPA